MLSVVVPAFREGGTIHSSLERLLAELGTLDRSAEVIVVSDGSDDNTVDEARRHPGVTVLAYPDQRGKGYALRFGVARARGDRIAFIDADLDIDPAGIRHLLALIDAGADAAIASKRHPGSHVDYPTMRRVQSAAYQRLIRWLFDLDVSDTQTGLKVFRGDRLREACRDLESDGFAFDLELLVALRERGSMIAEGPVTLVYQFSTTTSLRATVQVLRDTFTIYWKHRRSHRVPR